MMKKIKYLLTLSIGMMIFTFCQQKTKAGDEFKFEQKVESKSKNAASTRIDLDRKGVGPITEVKINETIDQEMVAAGAMIFNAKCVACHKVEEKFIGPAMQGVTGRRSPEWIMNMMLNPNQMVNEDSLAMELFIEYDGMPMSNMGLSAAEARQVLEYFRTIE